nr:hypothetical protein LR48_Vigan11g062200 [Ipomoea trifida]
MAYMLISNCGAAAGSTSVSCNNGVYGPLMQLQVLNPEMYEEIMCDDIHLFLVERLLGDSDVSEMLSAVTPSSMAADGFMAKGITFRNTAGRDSNQAVAFSATSDKGVLYQCAFEGYQDTLYLGVADSLSGIVTYTAP